MKKHLFIIILFYLTQNLAGFAQCTPDPTYTGFGIPGIWPDTVTGIASGTMGTAYSQNFTVIVPIDTTVTIPVLGTITATINSVSITGITGLPSGLSHACDISSCLWPGNTNRCFLISGTPNQSGNFTFSVTIVANVESPLPFPLDGAYDAPAYDIVYNLTIDSTGTTTSIKRIEEDNIEVYGISPNPSNLGAKIRFKSPGNQNVSFTVHNMIGVLVMSKQIYSEQGMNIVSIDTGELNPGVFIITLIDGVSSSSKKMVIGAQ